MGMAKGLVAALIIGDCKLLYISMYSSLYMTSILPSKIYSLLTMKKKKWGTSGRNVIKANFEGLIPVFVWFFICICGVLYSLSMDKRFHVKQNLQKFHDYMISGATLYILYWLLFSIGYYIIIKPSLVTKKEYELKYLSDVL